MYLFTMPINKAQKITFLAAVLAALAVATAAAAGTNLSLVGSTREAQVERVVHLGFEVRAELVRDDGETLAVQLTRDQAAQLELERGQIVYVRPTRETTF